MESAWKEGQSKEEWVLATCWLPGLASSAELAKTPTLVVCGLARLLLALATALALAMN